jgi:drug/metabolite transporter (DMT)-like permease
VDRPAHAFIVADLAGFGAMRAQPGSDVPVFAALAIGVLSVSTSGALIVYAAAPALAIAFWRNAMALPVLVPAAVVGRRHELRALLGPARREGLYCVLAGVALAGHFSAWVPSTKLTTVATATALVATQPVWAGLIAVGQGKRLPGWTWVGIAVAVVGAVLATGADISAGGAALIGDLLALAGGLLAAIYTSLGERARATTSTTAYTAVCYTVCGLVMLAICLVGRIPLTGYPATAWVALVALTVGPQLLGHSMFNFALRRVSATTVSVVILLEVPGAALVAWAWLGQVPRTAALPGLALLLVGVAIVVVAARRPRGAKVLEEPEAGVISPG